MKITKSTTTTAAIDVETLREWLWKRCEAPPPIEDTRVVVQTNDKGQPVGFALQWTEADDGE